MYLLVMLLVTSSGDLITSTEGLHKSSQDCYAMRETILYKHRDNELKLQPGVQAVCILVPENE